MGGSVVEWLRYWAGIERLRVWIPTQAVSFSQPPTLPPPPPLPPPHPPFPPDHSRSQAGWTRRLALRVQIPAQAVSTLLTIRLGHLPPLSLSQWTQCLALWVRGKPEDPSATRGFACWRPHGSGKQTNFVLVKLSRDSISATDHGENRYRKTPLTWNFTQDKVTQESLLYTFLYY